ncbi:MAG: hypothetical protein H6Q25_1616 [Bacteroidetes bacterium]|nr:hypothetical protein [Bacteroidota bacterium]
MKSNNFFIVIVLLIISQVHLLAQNQPSKAQMEEQKFPKKFIFINWELYSDSNAITLFYSNYQNEFNFKYQYDSLKSKSYFPYLIFDSLTKCYKTEYGDYPKYFYFMESFDTINACFKVVDKGIRPVFKKGFLHLRRILVKYYILEYNNDLYQVFCLNNNEKYKKGDLIHAKITDIFPVTTKYYNPIGDWMPILTYISNGFVFTFMNDHQIYKFCY